jgi:UDP-N-acetylglucosamine 4,6-dehydratase
MSDNLKSSVVTITGGTGSFGSTMLKRLLSIGCKEVRIFSRDENKQDALRSSMLDERVKFFIGDVRDRDSVSKAIRGSDYVFHAAALKQVPSCEFFPMQAIATNVNGSFNVIDACFEHSVKSVVCLSTDKAVYPINVMGMTKATMEKTAQSFARNLDNAETRVAITRYGNVMMSRGSVIPLFVKQIQTGSPITITDPKMTRFMMSLEDSVELVEYAFKNAQTGDLFVQKAPACTILDLAKGVSLALGKSPEPEIRIIGVRHGEKIYESLLGSEERAKAEDLGNYFRVPLDSRSLDYNIYFDKGTESTSSFDSFDSQNTNQLNSEEVANLLENNKEFNELIRTNS